MIVSELPTCVACRLENDGEAFEPKGGDEGLIEFCGMETCEVHFPDLVDALTRAIPGIVARVKALAPELQLGLEPERFVNQGVWGFMRWLEGVIAAEACEQILLVDEAERIARGEPLA
jgi:hypothetical protein